MNRLLSAAPLLAPLLAAGCKPADRPSDSDRMTAEEKSTIRVAVNALRLLADYPEEVAGKGDPHDVQRDIYKARLDAAMSACDEAGRALGRMPPSRLREDLIGHFKAALRAHAHVFIIWDRSRPHPADGSSDEPVVSDEVIARYDLKKNAARKDGTIDPARAMKWILGVARSNTEAIRDTLDKLDRP